MTLFGIGFENHDLPGSNSLGTVKRARGDDIFRPRMLGNSYFATETGYGTTFSVGGVDSEGLGRQALDYLAKRIATANRMLPHDCVVFEYCVIAEVDSLPSRPIRQDVVRQQALERMEFLKENARFRSVRCS